MADYPSAIPTLATHVDLTVGDFPSAEHLNKPGRNIEAICRVLGKNPRSISPVVPKATFKDVAAYLDMLAHIAKTLTGATNWYGANVPARDTIWGHGNANTIGAGVTTYIHFWALGINTTENLSQIPVAYAGNVANIRCQILTAQPGTGSLVFTLRKNGIDTALTFTIGAGSGGGTVGGAAGSVAFAAGDLLSLKVVNNASGNSGQIGGWSAEYDQTG